MALPLLRGVFPVRSRPVLASVTISAARARAAAGVGGPCGPMVTLMARPSWRYLTISLLSQESCLMCL